VANLFEGSDAAVAYVGCVGCVVAHNTIVDPQNWILRILQETTTTPPYTFEPCRDGVFIDNLVSFERAALSTHVNIGPNTAPATFVFASNLWYAWDDPGQSQPSLPAPETNGLYGVDPELGPGYRIAPSSPAAGSGSHALDLGRPRRLLLRRPPEPRARSRRGRSRSLAEKSARQPCVRGSQVPAACRNSKERSNSKVPDLRRRRRPERETSALTPVSLLRARFSPPRV